MTEPDRHGTDAEYQAHRKRGEKPCEACTRAKRDYVRKLRSRKFYKDQERQKSAARERALARLAKMHPAEYRALVAEEQQS